MNTLSRLTHKYKKIFALILLALIVSTPLLIELIQQYSLCSASDCKIFGSFYERAILSTLLWTLIGYYVYIYNSKSKKSIKWKYILLTSILITTYIFYFTFAEYIKITDNVIELNYSSKIHHILQNKYIDNTKHVISLSAVSSLQIEYVYAHGNVPGCSPMRLILLTNGQKYSINDFGIFENNPFNYLQRNKNIKVEKYSDDWRCNSSINN